MEFAERKSYAFPPRPLCYRGCAATSSATNGEDDPIGAGGGVGAFHQAELEPSEVSLGAGWNDLGASERVVLAGVDHKKRRWMRIFTFSRRASPKKRDAACAGASVAILLIRLIRFFSRVADDISNPKTNVARATIA